MSRDPLDRARTLTDALEALVEQRPDAEALVFVDRREGERSLKLRDLWERARSVQSGLTARGLRPGEVVVLVLPTSPELIAVYFGAVLAGGIPAMLSTRSHRVSDASVFTSRVAHVVANSAPHSVVCEADTASLLGQHATGLSSTLLLQPGPLQEAGSLATPVRCDPERIATMQYSSGTTGTPKGVRVSHRAVLNNLRSMRAAFELTESDVAVNWIPLFHDMGLFGAFLLPLLCGCKTVLIPTMDFMRDPAIWLRAFDTYRGTFAWAPHLAYALCARRLADEDLEGLDLSSWRIAVNASEPALASTLRDFCERMAKYGFARETMCPGWGLAEATVFATLQSPRQAPRSEVIDREALVREETARPTAGEGVSVVSIGVPIPDCTIEIRDARRRPLPERHVGKVWLRSNALFSDYHGDEERTKRVLVDGWLDTGDRGYLADGELFFVARDKDLILIGGEKYVPDDVEAVINGVPGVRAGCAVAFGVLNAERGTEELAAVVETRVEGDELSRLADDIRAAVSRSIGLGIRHLHLVPPGGIEKTTSGKLSRTGTRNRYPEVFGAGDAA